MILAHNALFPLLLGLFVLSRHLLSSFPPPATLARVGRPPNSCCLFYLQPSVWCGGQIGQVADAAHQRFVRCNRPVSVSRAFGENRSISSAYTIGNKTTQVRDTQDSGFPILKKKRSDDWSTKAGKQSGSRQDLKLQVNLTLSSSERSL